MAIILNGPSTLNCHSERARHPPAQRSDSRYVADPLDNYRLPLTLRRGMFRFAQHDSKA